MPDEVGSATRQNRESWDRYSRDYQAEHHDALDGDVFWGPAIPGERELRLLGDVEGKDTLELGCGGGQASVHLATLGARATGLDLAPGQLAHARALAEARGVAVRFLEGSGDDLSAFADASFDVVFSSYAMGFVEHLDAACAEAMRVLRPGGRFVFSWSSPIQMSTSLAPDGTVFFDRSYFDASPHAERDEYGTAVSFHRTYGDWHAALVRAGFVVTGLLEPPASSPRDVWRRAFPPEKLRVVPGTTIWQARKPRALAL